MEDMHTNASAGISRRTFISGSAIAGTLAALGLAGCAPKTGTEKEMPATGASTSDISWDEECEVLVVGSGYSGLAAAIEALPTLQYPHLKHGTWCVRYMEGGNPGTLVVPEKCYLFVDRYVVPGETDEICIAQIMEAAEQLGLSGKVDVRLKPRKSPYMQSFAVEEDHPLVKILQEEFYSVTGKDLPCAYDASVCDSNILAVSLGIPVVTFGPSGGNMHGDNEYGYAWQVKNCGEVYRRTVARLLSGEV